MTRNEERERHRRSDAFFAGLLSPRVGFDLSDNTLCEHCIGNLHEACDVAACNEVVAEAVLLCGVGGYLVDVVHDGLELLVNFFSGPAEALGVLAHLEGGNSNAACVNSLGRSYDEAFVHEVSESFVGGGHVCNFDVVLGTVVADCLCLGHADLVLICAGHADVELAAPGLLLREELYAELVCVILYAVAAGSTHLEHIVDLLFGDNAVRIVDVTVGTCEGDDLCAELGSLLGYAPGNVTEAGDTDDLAFDGVVLMLENFVEVINSTETGCFGTDKASAVGETLTGENAVLVSADYALILTEEVADLTSANADIACGNVDVGTDVTVELGHEGLAETHDFAVALAVGIEVGAALTAADGEGGEAVFEDLLEAEELQNAEVYVGSEAETAFVRADCAVELYPVTTVYLYVAVVVNPGYSELDCSFRLGQSFKQSGVLILGVLLNNNFEGFEYLFDCLQELGLVSVALSYLFQYFFNVSVHGNYLHQVIQIFSIP